MSRLELFHFLRPLWLAAVPLIVLAWWLARRRESSAAETTTMVAAHLGDALSVGGSAGSGVRPVDAVAFAALAMALAAAGPTWTRQASPWFAETAPLVVAIEVSDSMRANDLQPSRLERARFKVLDLIRARTGSRTAILAYAGSAHIVLPPSSDVDVLKPFLEGLDPAIMPVGGANAAAVLPLARSVLGEDATISTVLFVNDGFDPADVARLAEFSSEPDSPALSALVLGTDAGGVALMPDGSPVTDASGARLDTRVDAAVLKRVSREAKVSVVRSQSDDADIRDLLRIIASNLQQADDADARWLDQGWWLLWPAALLTLLWFRRGWTMQW